MTTPNGPGTFADLNADRPTTKNWAEQALTRGSSAANAAYGVRDAAANTNAGNLADGSSAPEWTSAVISARQQQLELMQNPGQAFLDNGLGFLVSIVLSPLIEIAEQAVGDPEQMRATGKGWEQVAQWLDEVGDQEKQRAEATASSWVGADGDAFRKQMTEFGDGSKALAEDVRGLKDALDNAADLFDMFVELFINIITELIISLIIQWLAALAASWITAGASVGAAGATTTASVGITGGRIATQVAKVQAKLYKLLKKLEEILSRMRESGFWGRRMANMVSKGKMEDIVDPNGNKLGEFGTSKTKNVFMGRNDLHKTGEEALAANLAGKGLGAVLGGEYTIGKAVGAGAMETAEGYAVKQIPKEMYNEADQRLNGEITPEERQATQERGFS
ncbi:WXG100 family type VII secretion target [Saccharopolyspora sp. CA-218241]|uniref:WXG100 family type VII secretion target n=1 Tax=Saccharopolyspora sp. CA-218241 TaxID=3240027 RepID=UPI003D98C240